ncbi:MAG: MlaD family protein [Planctomycetota bacterium]
MEERRRNVLVGLFVLLGLTAMATLIVLFGRGPTWLMRRGTYELHVRFEHVGGIREGTLVTFKGFEIGRVDRVRLQGEAAGGAGQLLSQGAGAEVVLAIKMEHLVPKGSTAETREPMLGEGRPPIEIIAGPAGNPALEPGAVLQGEIRTGLDSLFPPGIVASFESTARNVGDAAAALTPVLEEMRGLLERRAPSEVDRPGGLQGNISSSVARLDAALKHWNDVMGDGQVKSQVRETVANVRQASVDAQQTVEQLREGTKELRAVIADAKEFIGQADSTLKNMDGRVNDVARSVTESLDRADHFLDQLNVIADKVASGDGNVGRLIMDNKLYEAMQITAERLALALEEFRALMVEWREKGMRARL